MSNELSKERTKYKMKKINMWKENKVRGSKVSEKTYVEFYWKMKWLNYYERYQNE